MLYVTMTDKFMSGWGPSDGLINKLIFLCEDYTEAQIVYNNALSRGDQKYINICSSKPSYYRSTFGDSYTVGDKYVQIKTKDNYPTWYQK